MRGEDLRKEIFGNEGFANWLRREKLSPKALAQKAQERTQAKLGVLNCEKVNDFLCSLVDDEYEIYLEVERELIETAIENFLKAGEEERRKYPNLSRLILQVQTQIIRNSDPIETLIEISKPLAHFYKLLMESFAQSRKTRAGGSAQYHIEFILDELGYKGLYERQRILNGTKVQRLNEQNVYLIVRDVIKQGRFPQEANVLGFTDFFCKELPRLKDRWK